LTVLYGTVIRGDKSLSLFGASSANESSCRATMTWSCLCQTLD
jgi:hypothetical protein